MGDETTANEGATKAGEGATAAATGDGKAPAGPEKPWYASFEDEGLRGFAELKGWKTPADAVKSYQGAEKLIGVPPEQILRLPKADAPFEERLAIYDKLGRPKTPDDYKLEVPEGGDPVFAKGIAPILHKNGITAEQARGLNRDWNAWMAGMVEADIKDRSLKSEAEKKEIEREWGAKYPERLELYKRGAALVGFEEAEWVAMENTIGTARMMRALANLGEKMAEDKFVAGKAGGEYFGMTPAAAQAQIDELMRDQDFVKRYTAGDGPAKAKMDRLHQILAPEALA